MTQTFKIPAQGLSFRLPEVGQVFTDGDSIYKRTGDSTFIRLSEDRVAKTDLRAPDGRIYKKGESVTGVADTGSPVDRGFRGAHTEFTTGANKFRGQYDFNQLEKFNLGDLGTAISRMFGTNSRSINATDTADITGFQPTQVADSGEVFTQKVDPANPHSFIVESNLQGITVGSQAPSALAQQASAQGLQVDPNQTQAPQAISTPAGSDFIGRDGQPYTLEQLNTAVGQGDLQSLQTMGVQPSATQTTLLQENATRAAQGLPRVEQAELAGLGVTLPPQEAGVPLTPAPSQPVQQPSQIDVATFEPDPRYSTPEQMALVKSAQANLKDLRAVSAAGMGGTELSTLPADTQVTVEGLTGAGVTPTAPTTPTIGVDSLTTPQAPITTSPLPQPQQFDLSQLTALTPKQETLETERTAIGDRIAGLETELFGKGDRQAQLDEEAGIAEKNRQVQEINNQIMQLNSDAFAATQGAEDRLAPTFAITGEQAAIERIKAVKGYALAAESQAIQGNLNMAMDLIDRSLEAEFGDHRAYINSLKDTLDENASQYNKEEKKRATELGFLLDNYERQLKEQETERRDIRILQTTIAEMGGRITDTSSFEGALAQAQPFFAAQIAKEDAAAAVTDGDDQFTLSTGQLRFDAEGNVVARGGTKATTGVGGGKVLSASALVDLDALNFAVQPGDTMADVTARNQVTEEEVVEVAATEETTKDGFWSKLWKGITGRGQTDDEFIDNL